MQSKLNIYSFISDLYQLYSPGEGRPELTSS